MGVDRLLHILHILHISHLRHDELPIRDKIKQDNGLEWILNLVDQVRLST